MFGNGKGQIFVKGEVVKTLIVETLIEEALRIAETMTPENDAQAVG